MDQVTIEYSFKPDGKFDMTETEKKTWSNRYSSFIDWQKCNTADVKWGWNGGGDYYCNGKLFFDNWYRQFIREYGTWVFTWYDSNNNSWSTWERGEGKDFKNSKRWFSTRCLLDGDYYWDSMSTLYHQYNEDLNQDWAAFVQVKFFYEIVTPQF